MCLIMQSITSTEPTKIDLNTHLNEWLTSSIQGACLQLRDPTWHVPVIVRITHWAGWWWALHLQQTASVRSWRNREHWIACALLCVATESVGSNYCWGPADPCRRSRLTVWRIIWRSCPPPLAHIDFLCSCWIQHSRWRDPAAPPIPFVFSANEILMRGPGPFFSFISSLIPALAPSLSLSLFLAVLTLFSGPLCRVYHHLLYPCVSSAIFKQMAEERTVHCLFCVWI